MSIQSVSHRFLSFMTGSLSRTIALVAVCLAFAGPLLLLAFGGKETSQLPWYTYLIVLFLGLIVIGIGYYMFKRDSQEATDISISPRRR